MASTCFIIGCANLKDFALADSEEEQALITSEEIEQRERKLAFYEQEFEKQFNKYNKESPTGLYYSDDSKYSSPPPLGCHALCMFQPLYIDGSVDILVYNGSDLRAPYVKYDSILIKEGGINWNRKREKGICHEFGKDACMFWDGETKSDIYKNYYSVTDTSKTKEFKIQTISTKVLQNKNEQTQWRKVICDDLVTNRLINFIKDHLALKGFFIRDGEQEWDVVISGSTMLALYEFQKAYDLPIGYLDYETLYHLGLP